MCDRIWKNPSHSEFFFFFETLISSERPCQALLKYVCLIFITFFVCMLFRPLYSSSNQRPVSWPTHRDLHLSGSNWLRNNFYFTHSSHCPVRNCTLMLLRLLWFALKGEPSSYALLKKVGRFPCRLSYRQSSYSDHLFSILNEQIPMRYIQGWWKGCGIIIYWNNNIENFYQILTFFPEKRPARHPTDFPRLHYISSWNSF